MVKVNVSENAKLVVKSPDLPGTEVRCQAKILKNYEGVQKLKTCNALLMVIETDLTGYGSVTFHTKCTKAGCGNMLHYTLDF